MMSERELGSKSWKAGDFLTWAV